MVAKLLVNLVVLILKPENVQCQSIKFIRIGNIENPMGIKLFHSGPKVPKNKKALREKGFKNMLFFILRPAFWSWFFCVPLLGVHKHLEPIWIYLKCLWLFYWLALPLQKHHKS